MEKIYKIAFLFFVTNSIVFPLYAAQFEQYPAAKYTGKKAPINLDSETRKYRTRLREAYTNQPNFAGHYIFTSWPAGTGCAVGAYIDVKTGLAKILPLPVCEWESGAAPFTHRLGSRLIVFNGRLGEAGVKGEHLYELLNEELKPARRKNVLFQLFGGGASEDDVVQIAPEAGPQVIGPTPQSRPRNGVSEQSSEIPPDIVALKPDRDLTTAFAGFLAGLLYRFGYAEAEHQERSLSPELLMQISDGILRSSVRQSIIRDGVRYDLLFSSMADTFFIIEHNKKAPGIGAVSASKVSGASYNMRDGENYFDAVLKQRPALFRAFVRDFQNIPEPTIVFAQFLQDEKESRLLQENIKAALQLIAWGTEDPCRTYARAFLRNAAPKFGGREMPHTSEFYPNLGISTPQGRVLGFADEKTNRYFGLLIFDENDKKQCKPKAVVTSAF